MKVKFKNVAFAIATVALASVIAHQAYAKQQELAMSDVMLSNVEALSDEEYTIIVFEPCIYSEDSVCPYVYEDEMWFEQGYFE